MKSQCKRAKSRTTDPLRRSLHGVFDSRAETPLKLLLVEDNGHGRDPAIRPFGQVGGSGKPLAVADGGPALDIQVSPSHRADPIGCQRRGANGDLRRPASFPDFIEIAGRIGSGEANFNQVAPAHAD